LGLNVILCNADSALARELLRMNGVRIAVSAVAGAYI